MISGFKYSVKEYRRVGRHGSSGGYYKKTLYEMKLVPCGDETSSRREIKSPDRGCFFVRRLHGRKVHKCFVVTKFSYGDDRPEASSRCTTDQTTYHILLATTEEGDTFRLKEGDRVTLMNARETRAFKRAFKSKASRLSTELQNVTRQVRELTVKREKLGELCTAMGQAQP